MEHPAEEAVVLACVITHHVRRVPARAKEEVPDQKQQQTQRQHVQFEVPHHHHKELKNTFQLYDEDSHLEVTVINLLGLGLTGA